MSAQLSKKLSEKLENYCGRFISMIIFYIKSNRHKKEMRLLPDRGNDAAVARGAAAFPRLF